MAKLIQLQEAADMLGVSPEELVDMRSRNEIAGYRDGSNWKFKLEEIERVRSERASMAPADDTAGDDDAAGDMDELVDIGDLSLDDDPGIELELDSGTGSDADVIEVSDGDDSDSILVSEEELGKSDENTASTIIGEADDLLPQDSGIGGSDALADASDLDLPAEESDVVAASDIFAEGEKPPVTASDTANLQAAASSDVAEDVKLQDSGSMELSLEDSSVDEGAAESVDASAQASSSGFGSAIDLGLDDDELVLGSGTGSDVTSGAGDSGINLGNPADSGLSLEEPLEMSGAEPLELGEEDMLDLDPSMSGGSAADDDFMLTPVEEIVDEESDSGSQVIALDEEEFGESAVEMLTEDDEGLDAGAAEFVPDEDEDAVVGFASTATMSAAPIVAGDADEGYSIWNVLSLFSIVVVLSFTGILMLDLISNMWAWDGTFSFNSTIMDAILNMMPG